MSSHDVADRTLPPTERHRREARARGVVPRSADLTSATVLLTASCCLWSIAPASLNTLTSMMKRALTSQPQTTANVGFVMFMVKFTIAEIASILWPVFLVLAIVALTANLIQTGWLWIPSVVLPRFRQSSIVSWDKLAEATMRLVRLGVLALISRFFLRDHLSQFFAVAADEPLRMLTVATTTLCDLCVRLSLCLVVFALVDYGFRYWRNEQNLKMTIEERRRQQHEEVLDPQIKRRLTKALRLRRDAEMLNGIERISSKD